MRLTKIKPTLARRGAGTIAIGADGWNRAARWSTIRHESAVLFWRASSRTSINALCAQGRYQTQRNWPSVASLADMLLAKSASHHPGERHFEQKKRRRAGKAAGDAAEKPCNRRANTGAAMSVANRNTPPRLQQSPSSPAARRWQRLPSSQRQRRVGRRRESSEIARRHHDEEARTGLMASTLISVRRSLSALRHGPKWPRCRRTPRLGLPNRGDKVRESRRRHASLPRQSSSDRRRPHPRAALLSHRNRPQSARAERADQSGAYAVMVTGTSLLK